MTQYFVYPGQLFFADHEAQIKTILGSCVSVVFWDKTTRIGGLCHYLLPELTAGALASPRYGSFAIPELLQGMVNSGAARETMQAKVYGGGNVVGILNRLDGGIGERNIAEAHRQLKALHIPLLEENTGGARARLITLNTSNFQVDHRFAESRSQAPPLADAKAPHSHRIRVLIVDDSKTMRALFTRALAQSQLIEVVGTAEDPFDAREKIIALKPDVVTLDIEMPKMDGLVFLEKLMRHHPLPVVMVASTEAKGAAAHRAFELGAVDFLQKPSHSSPNLLSELGEILIEKIVLASTARLKAQS